MADSSPTAGDLFNAKAIPDEQVNAAIKAYLANPETDAHPIADGYVLDLGAVVRSCSRGPRRREGKARR
ncbi:hypothetical protein ABS772_07160 [Methylorubrum podarium]|uniref:Uncharacterized protein n=1 Tax=Methylorubrum podarium TaxID=200476 RepID=A0ABV1QJY8_9HYPH